MVRVRLNNHLALVAGAHGCDVATSQPITVRTALAALLQRHPILQPFVLDGACRVRADVAIFHATFTRRLNELDVLDPNCRLYVMRSTGPYVGMCWSSDWRQHRREAGRPERADVSGRVLERAVPA